MRGLFSYQDETLDLYADILKKKAFDDSISICDFTVTSSM